MRTVQVVLCFCCSLPGDSVICLRSFLENKLNWKMPFADNATLWYPTVLGEGHLVDWNEGEFLFAVIVDENTSDWYQNGLFTLQWWMDCLLFSSLRLARRGEQFSLVDERERETCNWTELESIINLEMIRVLFHSRNYPLIRRRLSIRSHSSSTLIVSSRNQTSRRSNTPVLRRTVV